MGSKLTTVNTISSQNITCEIVTIGTELLLGQIIDTNTTYLAQELASAGIDVRFRTSVGDKLEEIIDVLKTGINRVDLIIATGGLGPTEDDLTREAVARLAGVSLEFREDLMAQIEAIFKKYGYNMPENNRRQAYIPADSIPISNPVGTAPAFIKEVHSRPIICLPGVPRELKYLMKSEIMPWLRQRFRLDEALVTYKVLKTVGIGESKVDTIIGDLIKNSQNPRIGLLASPGEIRIRIAAKASDPGEAIRLIEPVEREIRSRLGKKIFGENEDTLESVIESLLVQHKASLSIIETFTGGLAAQRLHVAASKKLKASIVLPAQEMIDLVFKRKMGKPDIDDTVYLAEAIKGLAKTDVALAIVGFMKKKDDSYEVDACTAAIGRGMRKTCEWHMGGDFELLQQRGSVVGLNTLRLALL